ncbi:hypothetical protein HGRIS_008787 [Hohenbuehelia grisea]|uniref:Uncharacterized protein n=1 Tax=Hohenbuehelia grisea TaxID=104357 RepID=A0ABR3J957_9AGAR
MHDSHPLFALSPPPDGVRQAERGRRDWSSVCVQIDPPVRSSIATGPPYLLPQRASSNAAIICAAPMISGEGGEGPSPTHHIHPLRRAQYRER